MRLSRLLLPMAGALVAAVLTPTVASAQPYPPSAPVVTVSESTVVVGDTVEVRGTGFAGGELVEIAVNYQSIGMGRPRGARSVTLPVRLAGKVRVRADSAGAFRHPLTLTRAGRAIITCTGLESGRSGSASVLVLTSRSELPTTGTDGTSYLRIAVAGLAATVFGGVLVAFSLRRRRARGSLS
jgi:hypothetical protein